MKWYKVAALALAAILPQSVSFAYDSLWFDKEAGIERFQKVVVYPIALNNRQDFRWDNKEPFATYNYELHKRLTRHVKGIKFYELFKMVDTKNVLVPFNETRMMPLFQKYPSEAARAADIQQQFAADGYLTTYYREKKTEVDHSPEIWTDLHLYAYTEETDGPNGNRVYDRSDWWEHHCTPARDLTRYISELEYTMYDEDGKKILTCVNKSNKYNRDYSDQFKDLKDDFVEDFQDIKKNKFNKKPSEKAIRKMGFGELTLPSNLGNDEYMVKAAWFAYKDEAQRMKNVKLDMSSEDSFTTDYYVTADIQRCEYQPEWVPPRASTSRECVWSRETKWKDKDGKEHTMKTKRYVDKVVDHFGYYDMSNAYKLSVTMSLYNARTNQLLHNQSYYRTNDKEMDAFREILKDFYGKIDKIVIGKKP